MIKDLFLILPAVCALFVILNYVVLKIRFENEIKFFINTLSHDFRVSLLAQRRGLEILKNSYSNCFKNELIIDDVMESTDYTLDMVSVLLNSYKYESGEKSMYPEYFNISHMLDEVVKLCSKQAVEKDIVFETRSCNAVIYADKKSLLKAVQIFILCAISHSVSAGRILCSLNSDSKNTTIKIRYKGSPLTYLQKSMMFSKNKAYSAVGGGLRMYFAKKVTELNGGFVEVFDTDEESNEFVITLQKNFFAKYQQHKVTKLFKRLYLNERMI